MVEQLAVPVRLLANGRLATVEQGSDREITQRVSVLCRTPPGWVEGRPGVGLAEQAFEQGGADLAEVERQIRGLGPDVVAAITEDPSLMSEGIETIGLQVAAAAAREGSS